MKTLNRDSKLFLSKDAGALALKARELLAREVAKRAGFQPAFAEAGSPRPGDLVLETSKDLPPDGYQIRGEEGSTARVVGGDERGLLYGCGYLLRHSHFRPGTVQLCGTTPVSAPKHPIRGIYFATHFGNFYDKGPIEEVCTYLEDLALWGANMFVGWFDMHGYTGINDPAAQVMLARLRTMHATARGVGMKVGLGVVGNESYRNSPKHLLAVDPGRGFNATTDICPSIPEGLNLIVRQMREEFDQFEGVDFLSICPYDEGGCGCERCRPYGTNGFLRAGEPIAQAFRDRFPAAKVILFTWCFDQAEWDGLTKLLEEDLDWVDFVMGGLNRENEPPKLETLQLPRRIPLLNFPEITVWLTAPCGASGANPRPAYYQNMWDRVGHRIAGSFPYSEGRHDDINKVLWLQLNWDPDRPAADILREYAGYHVHQDHAETIATAMELMETTLHRTFLKVKNLDRADKIWNLVAQVEANLPEWTKTEWRWRILFLRAQLDAELKASGCQATEKVRVILEELSRVLHSHWPLQALKQPASK